MAYFRKVAFCAIQNAKIKSASHCPVSISARHTIVPSLKPSQKQNRVFTNIKTLVSKSSSNFATDSTKDNEEGLEPPTSTKKPVDLSSKKLPMSIRSLLERRPKDSTFPKLFRLSKLSREFSFVSVTIDDTELLLQKQILSSNSRKNLHHQPHVSKLYLEDYMSNPVRSSERMAALKKLLKSYEGLEKDEGANSSTSSSESRVKIEKHGSSLNRINYYTLILRMGFAFENALRHFDQEEMKVIDHFCKSMNKTFSNPALLYLLWMGLFQKGTDLSFEHAAKLAKEDPEILNCLMEELNEYSKNYTKEIENTPTHLLFQNLPRMFCLGDISAFCQKLESSKTTTDQTIIYRALCFKSRALWNAGKYSKSLTTLAVASEFWLANLNASNSSMFLPLGCDVITVLSEIVESSARNDFEPAVNFFDVICDKLALTNPVPIIPYVCWIHYKSSEKFSSKCDEILQRFPSIEVCKNVKFERALTIDSMTIETKNYFISETVKNMATIDTELRSVNSTMQTSLNEEDEIIFSPKVIQDMLDVKVLELLKEEQFDTALQLITNESVKGSYPSEEILAIFAQNLSKLKDAQRLADLRNCLPLQTEISDKIYESELGLRLMQAHQKWLSGDRSLGLELVLSQYRLTLEEEFRVRFESFEPLLAKVRRFLRLYIEELLLLEDSAKTISIVEQEGKQFSEIYRDFSILALYWEIHFFSADFKNQTKASEILSVNPKLPQFLDIDHLLARADRYSEESLFRKLVEMCLQYDLETYEKTRALEGLLIHQCNLGTLHGAKSTLDYAIDSGITLGPDAMKAFLRLKSDLTSSKNQGFLSSISSLFGSKKEK